jgi:hypothetical protein
MIYTSSCAILAVLSSDNLIFFFAKILLSEVRLTLNTSAVDPSAKASPYSSYKSSFSSSEIIFKNIKTK